MILLLKQTENKSLAGLRLRANATTIRVEKDADNVVFWWFPKGKKILPISKMRMSLIPTTVMVMVDNISNSIRVI